MENILKIIIVLILISILNGIYYGTIEYNGYRMKIIPENVIKFLKADKYLNINYSSDKKIVFYTLNGCEDKIAFKDLIQKKALDSSLQKNYNFHSFESIVSTPTLNDYLEMANLKKYCRHFCIINPKNNEIFSMNATTNKNVRELDSIFEKLKDW